MLGYRGISVNIIFQWMPAQIEIIQKKIMKGMLPKELQFIP